MVRSQGFTLVEVLVALVVLEIGLLGVVGSLMLAARLMTRAEMIERGVAEVERAYDSLSAARAGAGFGSRAVVGGTVGWVVEESGWSRIRFGTATDSALVSIEARLEPGPGSP